MSRTNNYIAGLVALAAWLFAAAALAQQNTIDAFNVAVQGGRVIVRITTKEPLAAPPASFTVSTPARIAFDFPKTGNGLGRASQFAAEQCGQADQYRSRLQSLHLAAVERDEEHRVGERDDRIVVVEGSKLLS